MRFPIRRHPASGSVSESTTPLIDVVFLLLIFFLMTFSVVPPEGDLSILLPRAAAAEQGESEEMAEALQKRLPLQVRLVADSQGKLAEMRIDGRRIDHERPYEALQAHVLEQLESAPDADRLRDQWQVELKSDDALKYSYLVKAIDAVSGRKNDDGSVTRLLQRVKLATVDSPNR